MRDQVVDSFGKRGIGAAIALALLVALVVLAATQGNAGAAPPSQATPTPLPGGTATPLPDGTPIPQIIPTPGPVPTPEVSPTPVPGADGSETSGAAVLSKLTALLQEHVYGLTAATAAAIHDRDQEAQAAQGALEQNSADIARLFRSFYGEDAQGEFGDLWDEHVQHLLDYADTVAEDQDDRVQASEDVDQFASDLEAFLTDANPHLQQGSLEMLLQEHGRLMISAIEIQAEDSQGSRAIMAAQQAADQTEAIAALLASALVRQFSEEVQALDTIYAVVGAWNRRDVQAFLNLWTEEGFEQEFEGSLDEGAEFLPSFIGSVSILVHDFRDIEVNDDEASVDVTLRFGSALERDQQQLVREDGIWKMDTSEPLTPEMPEGVDLVDVEMNEFAFSYDEGAISDGFVAFRAINEGQQEHELALLKLDEDVPPIQELLATINPEEGPPAGVQFVAGTFAPPGEEQTLVLAYPLTPGRYAMVCFIPDENDPDGTPHALKGMVSEFEVE